jgi:hypothetical protein
MAYSKQKIVNFGGFIRILALLPEMFCYGISCEVIRCVEHVDILTQELISMKGPQWHRWLRHCATNRKVAGSIPDGVIDFIDIIPSVAVWSWSRLNF